MEEFKVNLAIAVCLLLVGNTCIYIYKNVDIEILGTILQVVIGVSVLTFLIWIFRMRGD